MKWTSVKDGLPKRDDFNKRFYITVQSEAGVRTVDEAFFYFWEDNGDWEWERNTCTIWEDHSERNKFDDGDEVIAWMLVPPIPFPEPYKEED